MSYGTKKHQRDLLADDKGWRRKRPVRDSLFLATRAAKGDDDRVKKYRAQYNDYVHFAQRHQYKEARESRPVMPVFQGWGEDFKMWCRCRALEPRILRIDHFLDTYDPRLPDKEEEVNQ